MSQQGGGGGGGVPFLGSRISLISKNDIRYEGILYNIDPKNSSVALREVRMFGTEGRRPDGRQIPAIDKIFEFIQFKGEDIRDLTVCEGPSSSSSSSSSTANAAGSSAAVTGATSAPAAAVSAPETTVAPAPAPQPQQQPQQQQQALDASKSASQIPAQQQMMGSGFDQTGAATQAAAGVPAAAAAQQQQGFVDPMQQYNPYAQQYNPYMAAGPFGMPNPYAMGGFGAAQGFQAYPGYGYPPFQGYHGFEQAPYQPFGGAFGAPAPQQLGAGAGVPGAIAASVEQEVKSQIGKPSAVPVVVEAPSVQTQQQEQPLQHHVAPAVAMQQLQQPVIAKPIVEAAPAVEAEIAPVVHQRAPVTAAPTEAVVVSSKQGQDGAAVHAHQPSRSNNAPRGGRGGRGGSRGGQQGGGLRSRRPENYNEEFDFEGSNAQFDKLALEDDASKAKEDPHQFYDRNVSFFDSISRESNKDTRRTREERFSQDRIDSETFGDAAKRRGGHRGGHHRGGSSGHRGGSTGSSSRGRGGSRGGGGSRHYA